MSLEKGYHYTSLACWMQIQQQGLVPYNIQKPVFRQHFGTEEMMGIWIWTQRQRDLSHQGCILYQMAMKNTTRAVLLSVGYDAANALYTADGGLLLFHHSGNIGNLEYHTAQVWEQAVIITKPIVPDRIELLQEYDLLKVWNGYEDQ